MPAIPKPSEAGASGSAAAPARAFASELFAGDVISDRYELIERLGQGGMGTVYKVLDHELDRVIALKTIRADLASNPGVIRRFKQEILLARQVTHRNVIRIFDFGVAQGLRFITMEFFEGENLMSRLRRVGKVSPNEAVAIIRQICEGLQAAHSEDVIHRDLKPHNILINGQNEIRIMDFGLAGSFDAPGVTRTGVLVGTPDYMSPEQARGEHADVRSDIFAVGLTCYELLTGDLPFKGESTVARLIQRTRERAQPLDSIDPSIPKRLNDIVARCLEPDPARRYQRAEEIVWDLDNRDSRQPLRASSIPGSLRPGSMLGSRYRIEAEAGEGGMGKVYRATDLDLNRTVALKLVRPELSCDARSFEGLKREIQLASRITHRNVVRIHDLGEASGLRFISMAWVDGEDLEHLIRRSAPFPEDQVVRIAQQICGGLAAAHSEGIIHRDLKPRNILMDASGTAFVGDFGLAQGLKTTAITEISHPGEIAGTPRYMSPEQVEGKPVDQHTDIYSLGLILYEMATGDIPFKHDSVLKTMVERVTETPRSPKMRNPALSNGLTTVILRCLERDPSRRYDSVQELFDELQGLALRPSKSLKAQATGVTINPKWLALAAALICAVAVAAIYLMRPGGTPGRRAPAGGKYIAVLPFRPLGGDPNLKYDAEGISEAISSRLFSLSSVHPVSPLALEKVDLSQPTDNIAQKVGANLIVLGTIQGEGDHISVTANIQNVALHKWLWNKSFSGVQGDLLTIEDEICTQVIQALDVKPTQAERERTLMEPTRDIDAYDLYLKGRDLLKGRPDEKSTAAALQSFEQARTKDPSFALAWAGVADASLNMYRLKHASFWADKALAAARQARSENDGLPEVHFSLGSVYTQTGRTAEAVSEIKRALQLAPNSDDGYVRLGQAYVATGRSEAALAALKEAVELNPYYWYNYDQLGLGYFRMGRNADALKQFERVAELDPGNATVHNRMGVMYYRQNLWAKSIPEFQKAIASRPTADAYNNLGTAYYFLGRYPESIPMFERAVQMDPKKVLMIGDLADGYRQAGQWEKAQATYDRAIELAYEQLQVNRQDAGMIGNLALYYARKGGAMGGTKARQLIAQARSINPADNQLMYDEAIVEALGEHLQEAVKAVQRAVRNGYPVQEAEHDPDLKTIRKLAGFRALLKGVPH